MNDFKRFLSIIPQNPRIFWRGVVAYGLWTVQRVFNVHMLGVLGGYLEASNTIGLQTIIYLYAGGVIILHLLLYCTRNRGRTEIMSEYQKVIHRKYVPEFVYLDNNKCERIGTGKLISIIEKGISERAGFVSTGLERFMMLTITLLYVSYVLISIGVIYFLCFLLICGICCVVAYHFNGYMLEARKKRVNATNVYTKNIVRIIMAKVEIMQSRNQSLEMKKLDIPMNESIRANKNMNPYLHWFFWGPNLLVDIGRILIFGMVLGGFRSAGVNIGIIISLGASLILLEAVLSDSLVFYKDFTKNFDVVKRMRDLFDENKPQRKYTVGTPFIYKKGAIHLKNICFTYHKQMLFENFSLEIPGLKKIAFVGASGVGKSTLVKLIAGYLEPDSGNVFVDGQNLDDLQLTSYRKSIGYLTQDPGVFDGTVRENLLYALEDDQIKDTMFEAKLNQVVQCAKCEFIYDLPQGIDTEIGERGIRLSGGQRQRLAIAKLMLKNPDIIILDEPTSALDSFSEESVTHALHNLFAGKTVIIVAHRLQTVKEADEIIVLSKEPTDSTKVIERGTHVELVRQGGYYAKMLELQTGF